MTHTKLLPVLMALSFTSEEATTYIYLAEHGALNISALARGVKVSRITMNKVVTRLVVSGRINKVKEKRRALYEVCDPELLLAEFEQLSQEGSKALTFLSQTLHSTFFIPTTKVLSGPQGIQTLFEDIATTLPKGGTYYRYTSRKDDATNTARYKTLVKEKEIERLVITSSIKAETKQPNPNRFIKTVSKDFAFDDNVALLVYGNKVANVDYSSKTAIIIESPQLARFQEKIFKLLWKKL
jgi:sugar-specific transcriptional regulator TrmB